jgi:hypothetical protein
LIWLSQFDQPKSLEGRSHGTSIYLQSLKSESSDSLLKAASDAEWRIVSDQWDIQHARGRYFQQHS